LGRYDTANITERTDSNTGRGRFRRIGQARRSRFVSEPADNENALRRP